MANFSSGGVFDPTRDYQFSPGSTLAAATVTATSMGYGPSGAATGGTVTQITNRTTSVILNTLCGAITTNTASLAAEASAEFTVTNSLVAIGDVPVLAQRSGGNGTGTVVYVSGVLNGSFKIVVQNNNASGGTAETGAIIINFVIIKSVTT
jgi:hypothetical protein